MTHHLENQVFSFERFEEEVCQLFFQTKMEETQPLTCETVSLRERELTSFSRQKNYVGGLIDVALLIANANQLKHAMLVADPTYRIGTLVATSISIALQLVVGILLVLDNRLVLTSSQDLVKSKRYICAIQIVTVIIVVINTILTVVASDAREMPK